jgi:hypothetical protein
LFRQNSCTSTSTSWKKNEAGSSGLLWSGNYSSPLSWFQRVLDTEATVPRTTAPASRTSSSSVMAPRTSLMPGAAFDGLWLAGTEAARAAGSRKPRRSRGGEHGRPPVKHYCVLLLTVMRHGP